ncbi:MAG: ribbon-helix-helix protein, CopG family [Firmicutes bacterium]|nr:ribbon-helix-helix protein, CopG family [Bacillota bacterium]
MQDKNLSARLEVRLHPEQLNRLKAEANKRHTSVGNLVREAIDQKYLAINTDKLKAVEQMAGLNAPVASWEEMKREIESGKFRK